MYLVDVRGLVLRKKKWKTVQCEVEKMRKEEEEIRKISTRSLESDCIKSRKGKGLEENRERMRKRSNMRKTRRDAERDKVL